MFDEPIYLVSSSVYELAGLAKLPWPALAGLDFLSQEHENAADVTLAPLKLLLDVLVQQQYQGGSWGSAAYSSGDRLVNTLAAVAALAFNRTRWTQGRFPAHYQASLQVGLDWLVALPNYQPDETDPADLAGLELVVPALRAEIASYGLELLPGGETVGGENAVLAKARAKLGLVPPALIFHPGSTISHALEFTGPLLKPSSQQLIAAISLNGSVGNSPSATAFVLQSIWAELEQPTQTRMLDYLNRSVNAALFWRQIHPTEIEQPLGFSGLGWPVTYPVRHFLEIWYQYYLRQLGAVQAPKRLVPGTNSLLANLVEVALEGGRNRAGLGADEHFAVDADTTATYIYLAAEELVKAGQAAKLEELIKVLLDFFDEKRGWFFTYPYEMTVSVTTNAHAWQALDRVIKLLASAETGLDLDKLRQIRNRVSLAVKKQACHKTFWRDKWHMSPIYATYHVAASGVLTAEEGEPAWLERIIEWVLANQLPSKGGWNFGSKQEANITANVDETFHALLLLLYLRQHWLIGDSATTELERWPALVSQAIEQGVVCLQDLIQSQPPYTWPAMWCDKTLYCPYGMLYELSKKLLEQLEPLEVGRFSFAR